MDLPHQRDAPPPAPARPDSLFRLPPVILLVGLAIVYVLAFLLQRQGALYANLSAGEARLPAFSSGLLAIADWLTRHWYIPIPLVIVLALLAGRSLRGTPAAVLVIAVIVLLLGAILSTLIAMYMPVFNVVNVIQ